jgi:putative ABC transport system permease protein
MFTDLFFRLRALFRRSSVEAELDDELRFHFEREVAKYAAAGLSPEESRRRARLALGGIDQVREDCRQARGVHLIESTLQDIRYALRLLRRTPVITAVAIFSLALGIGANTAIFSLMDAVVLKMLPVHRPEELFRVERSNPRTTQTDASFTNPLWEEIRDRQDVFSSVFASSSQKFDLARGGQARYASGLYVSGEYFSTLGVHPVAGRLLSTADDRRGCPGAAVLSYGFWSDRYGRASAAIGSTLSLDGHPFEIIGVTAPGFFGINVGEKFDVAIPVCAEAVFRGKDSFLDHHSAWWLSVTGRLKPGVTREQAAARFAALAPSIFTSAVPKDWDADGQKEFMKRTLVLYPGGRGFSDLRTSYQRPLELLMAIVALVLLIACANIASLMLARAAAREREIAMRRALGASRGRLIRQLLTECVLLSSAGAVLGVIFARWGTAVLVHFLSTQQQQVFLDLSLNSRMLAFTTIVATLTGLLFGVLPAFRSTRVSLSAAVKGSHAPDSGTAVRFRTGKWIVASQVALSLVLLISAGLFLRSLEKLVTLDLGFDRNNVLLVTANLQTANVPPEKRLIAYEQIEARLGALPGVTSVSRSVRTPITNMEWGTRLLADSSNPPTGEDSLAFFNFVSPGYFETFRTPILAGRNFRNADTKTALRVAIINQTLAQKFYPHLNPIGRFFHINDSPSHPAPPIQIVGVVADAKYESIREETFSQAFFPASQIPEGDEAEIFELRTASPPFTVVPAVQDAVAGVNQEIPLEFRSLSEQVNDSLVQERLLATLSAFFGGLAVLLAIIGLYGAISYLVTQRRIEFGIRSALGAQPVSILQLVMRDVVTVLLIGLAAGVTLSLATLQLLQKMLFGLAPRDALTISLAVVLFSFVAVLAGLVPARRAMRVDPMVALRYE